MGDEDDAAAQITESAHVLEQLYTSAVVQGCGGLVDDQDLRIEISRLDDLDQLSVLEVVGVNDRVGADASEAVGIQKLLCLLVHGRRILDAVADEGILLAEEDVLCDRQAGQGSHLLDDDRDAVAVRVDLVLRVNILTVQREGAAAQ